MLQLNNSTNTRHLGRPDGGWILALNVSGETAPRGGWATLSFTPAYARWTITKPTSENDPNAVIIGDFDIPDGEVGIIWETCTQPAIYDVGNPPSVGGRVGTTTDSWYCAPSSGGTHLVRAASGGVAYVVPFSASSDIRIYKFHRYCYIKSDVPTSTFGYDTLAAVEWKYTDVWIGIVLLHEPIIHDLSAYDRAHLVMSPMTSPLVSNNSAFLTGQIAIYRIHEAFDASSIVYNDWAGLSKTTVGTYSFWTDGQRTGPNVGGFVNVTAPSDLSLWDDTHGLAFALSPTSYTGTPELSLALNKISPTYTAGMVMFHNSLQYPSLLT